MLPEYVCVPVKLKVPEPCFVNPPVPEIIPEYDVEVLPEPTVSVYEDKFILAVPDKLGEEVFDDNVIALVGTRASDPEYPDIEPPDKVDPPE